MGEDFWGTRRWAGWLCFPALALVALALALIPSSASASPRYSGWVEGAGSGQGHDFVVGDGLNVVFVDRKHDHTHYTACWHRQGQGDSHKHCWHQRTGKRGERDRVFTAAPVNTGQWIVHWRTHHHRVASWHFHIGPGD